MAPKVAIVYVSTSTTSRLARLLETSLLLARAHRLQFSPFVATRIFEGYGTDILCSIPRMATSSNVGSPDPLSNDCILTFI